MIMEPTSIRVLANIVNAMKAGEHYMVSPRQYSYYHWDWMRHGRGYEGFCRALREMVIGSSFGNVEINRLYDGGAIGIAKHECAERTHDRDGDPWPPVGPSRPPWARGPNQILDIYAEEYS